MSGDKARHTWLAHDFLFRAEEGVWNAALIDRQCARGAESGLVSFLRHLRSKKNHEQILDLAEEGVGNEDGTEQDEFQYCRSRRQVFGCLDHKALRWFTEDFETTPNAAPDLSQPLD